MSWTTLVLALAAVAGAPSHLGAGGAPSLVSLSAAMLRGRLAHSYAARRRTKASSAS